RHFEQLIIFLKERQMSAARLTSALEVHAAVLHRQGLSVWAARVYGLADTTARTSRPLLTSWEMLGSAKNRVEAVRAEVRARLGDAAFARACADGHTMTMEDLLTIPYPPSNNARSQARSGQTSVPFEPLTARELDVLRLLLQDLNNPQIAEQLVVSR